MSLGNSRPRSYGVEQQLAMLALTLRHRKLTYRTTKANPQQGEHQALELWVTGSNGDITLPFTGTCARLARRGRGKWIATHPWDGRQLACGISERDVVCKTVQALYPIPEGK